VKFSFSAMHKQHTDVAVFVESVGHAPFVDENAHNIRNDSCLACVEYVWLTDIVDEYVNVGV